MILIFLFGQVFNYALSLTVIWPFGFFLSFLSFCKLTFAKNLSILSTFSKFIGIKFIIKSYYCLCNVYRICFSDDSFIPDMSNFISLFLSLSLLTLCPLSLHSDLSIVSNFFKESNFDFFYIFYIHIFTFTYHFISSLVFAAVFMIFFLLFLTFIC